jgi:hypothetical protein
MKKSIWGILVILILIFVGFRIYSAQVPKILGSTVSYVKIMDTQGKPISEWTANEDKQAISTVSKAFSNLRTTIPVNQATPDYWLRIGLNDRSAPVDILVWLPSNQTASFIFPDPPFIPNGLVGVDGFQTSYPISDENRDKLLLLLKK